MRFGSFRLLMCLGMLLAVSVGVTAEMAGSAGRPATYQGTVQLKGSERCDLSIQVERVSFLITAFGNKYRLVRMLVDCRNQVGLTLSSSTDRLEMEVDKRAIPGVLSLQRSDSTLWDALSDDLRQTLAYPPVIKAGQPVYLFAYFPVDQVKTMPTAFSYTIASLGQTVMLRHLVAAA